MCSLVTLKAIKIQRPKHWIILNIPRKGRGVIVTQHREFSFVAMVTCISDTRCPVNCEML